MKVLLLTQVLPFPPDSGPKIKTWNLIKHLSRNHNITLVSFVRGDQSAEIRCLEQYCERVIAVPISRSFSRDVWAMLYSLFRGTPWVIARDYRPSMRQAIETLTRSERFDIIHADQLNMAQYALRVSGGRRILDLHNALWLLYRRLTEILKVGPEKLLWWREWRLLQRYEGKTCQVFDEVFVVSAEDRAALVEVIGRDRHIQVVPITIDPEDFPPVLRNPGANHIVSLGTMFWMPNVDGVSWFIREVFPHIRSQRPDVVFDILGARPPAEILRLAKTQPGISVPGYVKDPVPHLREAAVMVIPLRAGGGMRVKVLQALAQGLPVVSTSLGCEGIEVEAGRHLLIADTAEDFARATLQLLEDQELAAKLGQQGREHILARYSALTQLWDVDEVYRSVVEKEKV